MVESNLDQQLSCFDRSTFGILAELKRSTGAGLAGGQEPRLRMARDCLFRSSNDVKDRFRTDHNLHVFRADRRIEPAFAAFDADAWLSGSWLVQDLSTGEMRAARQQQKGSSESDESFHEVLCTACNFEMQQVRTLYAGYERRTRVAPISEIYAFLSERAFPFRGTTVAPPIVLDGHKTNASVGKSPRSHRYGRSQA
jgi:hypothetical protein